jgi:hypothetical protein
MLTSRGESRHFGRTKEKLNCLMALVKELHTTHERSTDPRFFILVGVKPGVVAAPCSWTIPVLEEISFGAFRMRHHTVFVHDT